MAKLGGADGDAIGKCTELQDQLGMELHALEAASATGKASASASPSFTPSRSREGRDTTPPVQQGAASKAGGTLTASQRTERQRALAPSGRQHDRHGAAASDQAQRVKPYKPPRLERGAGLREDELVDGLVDEVLVAALTTSRPALRSNTDSALPK